MDWLDALATGFPAPRDDEPANLRRQIVAELRDHLESAYQRELVLTGDAAGARQRVLDQFGDPAQLARKLWFEAMWGKIMSQRLLLVTLAVVLLVSVGSMGLTTYLVVQAREVNQALLEQSRAANQALFAQSQKANDALVAKLATVGTTDGNAGKSLEWNPLRVQLSSEQAGGTPVSGSIVALSGHILDTARDISVNRTTGVDGIADFGSVRPGQHSVSVKTASGDSMRGTTITVLPGEAQTVEIVCPPVLEETEVEIAIDWPEELAGRDLWLVSDFVRPPREIAGHTWTQDADHQVRYIAVNPSRKVATFNSAYHTAFGDQDISINPNQIRSNPGEFGIYRVNQFDNVPRIWLPKVSDAAHLKWLIGSYRVEHFVVARGSKSENGELPADMLNPTFVAGIANQRSGPDVVGLARLFDAHGSGEQGGFTPRFRYVKTDFPMFEAVAGKVNQWTLTLPPPLVDLVKTELAEKP